MNAPEIVAAWDAQQSAYIAGREQRFAVMTDVLVQLVADRPVTIIDLACGPGSLSRRVLEALPSCSVVAVDYDPVLLDLAREYLAPYGDRVQVVDADLTGEWIDQLGPGPFTAAMSTTALHWLWPDQLVRLFRQMARVLEPGGIFVDGDHFRFDDRTPRIAGWAAEHDLRTQEAAFAEGAPTWDQWWASLQDRPGHAERAAERERRFADRAETAPTAVDFRLAALANAGFAEVGTLWQLLDDYVVYGVLAPRSPDGTE